MNTSLAYLIALALSVWAASAFAEPAINVVKALSFSTADATAISVPLPKGTKTVAFAVSGGRLFCKTVRILASDGGITGVFGNDDLPDKASEKVSTVAQKSYVTVEATCKATDSGVKLVISAGH